MRYVRTRIYREFVKHLDGSGGGCGLNTRSVVTRTYIKGCVPAIINNLRLNERIGRGPRRNAQFTHIHKSTLTYTHIHDVSIMSIQYIYIYVHTHKHIHIHTYLNINTYTITPIDQQNYSASIRMNERVLCVGFITRKLYLLVFIYTRDVHRASFKHENKITN